MVSKRSTVITGVLLVIAIAIGVCIWWVVSEIPNGTYYAQVNNTRIEKQEPTGSIIDFTGGMPLAYKLPAFDESDKEKEISFGVERELRDDAYLELQVVPIRGVMEWSEVQFDEMPEKAQEVLAKLGE